MPFDSNKISNIIGTKIPQWLINQLDTRANQGARDSRDNNNILFLSNKTAWIRLVSSIDLLNPSDIEYFRKIVGDSIQNKEDLAKEFVLFGGTSKYLRENSYQQRSGIGKDGAYGILGDVEIQQFGYRPMPGITSVIIDTQGKLGSLRAATINFKCWDKTQLDIIDALYFKLGFTMFLEWGQTFFYPDGSSRVQSSEFYSIDPFKQNLTKEEIAIEISKNVRQSEGNYDALLGMVTNFNFTYNQDGGYDCTLKLMALGILGDSIKINNSGGLPGILRDEILLLSNTLVKISQLSQGSSEDVVEKYPNDLLQALVKLLRLQYVNPEKGFAEPFSNLPQNTFDTISFRSSDFYSRQAVLSLKYNIRNYELIKSNPVPLVLPSRWALKPKEGRNILTKDQVNAIKNSEFYEFDYIIRDSSPLYLIGRTGQILDTSKLSNYFLEFDANYLDEKIHKGISAYAVRTPDGDPPNKDFYEYKISYGKSQGPDYYNFDIKVYNKLSNAKVDNTQYKSGFLTIDLGGKRSDYILQNVIEKLKIIQGGVYESGVSVKLTQIKEDGTFVVTISYENFESPGTIERAEYYSDVLKEPDPGTGDSSFSVTYKGTVEIEFIFKDSSFINKITGTENSKVQINPYSEAIAKTNAQNKKQFEATLKEEQRKDQDARSEQILQALSSQSSLELILRTIEVKALTEAIQKTKSSEIDKKVHPFKIYNPIIESQNIPFYKQIFSNGIFSPIIDDLLNEKIDDNLYSTNKRISVIDRLKIYSKYGFATQLLSGESIENFKDNQVDFKELLRAYVVPYIINQEIVSGAYTNHPVYIPLGLLLMILNHNCTIYDSKTNQENQTPLVYIDFNPNLNFFLTNTKQLSTNPFKVLIPYEGTFSDYQALFSTNILNTNKDAILPQTKNSESIPLFKTPDDDLLSAQIPPIKYDQTTNNSYRGKLMNILLNIDYLVELVKDYSLKDGTNSIYLKPFLEQVIIDINKYLGNFNLLRLSYNDGGNTYQFIDDQILPPKQGAKETMLEPTNTTFLHLVGQLSIAKSLEIKTEVSSKLSSMIAISANADAKNKATLSTNGDSFGFINTNFVDRYIVNRGEISGNNTGSLDAVKLAASQFNQTISDFYSTINPSEANVSQATNYYINKMTNIKNDDSATIASAMIPVSVNFTTDGISGFTIGQAFTISDQLLPYTYNNRIVANQPLLTKDHINKVGFVVVGLTNTIENNQWNTAVRANMIFLKNATYFSGSVKQLETKNVQFGFNPLNLLSLDVNTKINSGNCEEPYVNTNLNRGWEGRKQAFQRTVIDPAVEGPKLKAKYGETLAKAILATIKIEQNFIGFNNNYAGFDITGGAWSFDARFHNGYVVAKEGGTNLCKAFISFISFEAFVVHIAESFIRKGFDKATTADSYAKLWLEKWNSDGIKDKYPDRTRTPELEKELITSAILQASKIWKQIVI